MNDGREEQAIRGITSILPAAPERLTPVFSSDCELAELDGFRFLSTLDDFSAEDRIRADDPERLGWNLACAALADVFACGGRARLFGHSLVPDPDWSTDWIETFSRGVGAALRACGCGFLGGDWGHGSEWRYTTHVIGTPIGRAVDRQGARPGDALYLSGRVGVGNLEAALDLYGETPLLRKALGVVRPRFRVLHREAELVSEFASAAIDTSDGLACALAQLAEQSCIGYVVDRVPYHQLARLAGRVLGKPALMLALGGCGEYEILFAVPSGKEGGLLEEAQRRGLALFRIGRVESRSPAIHELSDGKRTVDLGRGFPKARDYRELSTYLGDLERFAEGDSA